MANETVKVEKSKAEWQQQLSPEQYAVTREKGTERAFTGRYWDHHDEGIYRCVCCGTALFASDTKFDSGCGWPSYFKALDPANVREERRHLARHEADRDHLQRVRRASRATCFRTARRRPDCATASTPRR